MYQEAPPTGTRVRFTEKFKSSFGAEGIVVHVEDIGQPPYPSNLYVTTKLPVVMVDTEDKRWEWLQTHSSWPYFIAYSKLKWEVIPERQTKDYYVATVTPTKTTPPSFSDIDEEILYYLRTDQLDK